jgi:hypothetical protein
MIKTVRKVPEFLPASVKQLKDNSLKKKSTGKELS